MKKILRSMAAAILVGLLAGPQHVTSVYAAASGNYTDLLPIGAASDTTLISRGTGWAVATLPPTNTFGDSLSRLVDTVYQSTAVASINAATTVSTVTALGQGNVGSTTFPATWVATGRSIEIESYGSYSTPSGAVSNMTWGVKLGTTTILTTGALAGNANQISSIYKAKAILTIAATGNAGTVNGTYEILVASGSNPATLLSYSTGTIAGAVTVDLTSQLVVNPFFNWGTANSSMTVRNVVVKFLN